MKKINIFIRIADPKCRLHKVFLLPEDFYVNEKSGSFLVHLADLMYKACIIFEFLN